MSNLNIGETAYHLSFSTVQSAKQNSTHSKRNASFSENYLYPFSNKYGKSLKVDQA